MMLRLQAPSYLQSKGDRRRQHLRQEQSLQGPRAEPGHQHWALSGREGSQELRQTKDVGESEANRQTGALGQASPGPLLMFNPRI